MKTSNCLDNKYLNKELYDDLIFEKQKDIETESVRQKKVIKNVKIGILLILLCNLSSACNSLLIKFIQKKYNDIFRTIPFLFYRSFFILLLSQIIITIKGERILWPNEIEEKLYFFFRTNINFLGVQLNIRAIWYLRVATVQIINSLHPLIYKFMSIFILKEKFYIRYIFGIITCLIGAYLIIINEKKGNNDAISESSSDLLINEEEKKYGGFSLGTIFGLLFAFIDIFFVSTVELANKVLDINKVSIHTQIFYNSLNIMAYSLIYLFFSSQWYICSGYAFLIFFQSIIFYIGIYLFYSGLEYLDLEKCYPLAYSRIIFIFILGLFILGEKVYFSDILGSCLIIGYMIYNLYFPIIPINKYNNIFN